MLLLLLAMALSSGRAAVALTLFGVGAGTAAGTGVSSTLDSIADKTFTASEEHLRAAFFKDRATATELIIQTERTLDEEPMPARQETPTAAASARTK